MKPLTAMRKVPIVPPSRPSYRPRAASPLVWRTDRLNGPPVAFAVAAPIRSPTWDRSAASVTHGISDTVRTRFGAVCAGHEEARYPLGIAGDLVAGTRNRL